eukprot:scaffold486_cov38-Phaeocystis_antarctica.AAC.1
MWAAASSEIRAHSLQLDPAPGSSTTVGSGCGGVVSRSGSTVSLLHSLPGPQGGGSSVNGRYESPGTTATTPGSLSPLEAMPKQVEAMSSIVDDAVGPRRVVGGPKMATNSAWGAEGA